MKQVEMSVQEEGQDTCNLQRTGVNDQLTRQATATHIGKLCNSLRL